MKSCEKWCSSSYYDDKNKSIDPNIHDNGRRSKMPGIITDIQRFSLNDGPGIRTTVFFKGCNMNCAWCHNPETISGKNERHFYAAKCIGCGRCFEICPPKAHVMVNGVHKIDRNLCHSCGHCAEICYAQALIMSGKVVSAQDVMKEVLQDEAYYRDSGGGVTLSGGEVLCQKSFALEIIEKCRENGINVALETNLSDPYEAMEELLGRIDLVMCDIKLFDNEKHKKYTGVSNNEILSNVLKLDRSGIPYIVRTPLIPGISDSNENILSITEFLKPLKHLILYELLNFNPLGASKYASLDLKYDFGALKPLASKRLAELQAMVSHAGLTVKVG